MKGTLNPKPLRQLMGKRYIEVQASSEQVALWDFRCRGLGVRELEGFLLKGSTGFYNRV